MKYEILLIKKSHFPLLISYYLLSHLSESNQRPTDYKSVALPAELKWQLHQIQYRKELSQKIMYVPYFLGRQR